MSDRSCGNASVVRGGDGQEVHPDWVRTIRNDCVAGFEFRSPLDTRYLSSFGDNGAYEVKATRRGGSADVQVTFYKAAGGTARIHSANMDAVAVRDRNEVYFSGPMHMHAALRRNLAEAIIVAICRTFAEETEGYSLEPVKATIAGNQNLVARVRMGQATHKKERQLWVAQAR